MSPGMKKLAHLWCAGCYFFSYIVLGLLFTQNPLCQIRLVIKIKSTGKSAKSWRAFEKGLAVQSLKPCKQLLECYCFIFIFFFASFKGQALKNWEFIERILVQRMLQKSFSPETKWVANCIEWSHVGGCACFRVHLEQKHLFWLKRPVLPSGRTSNILTPLRPI